MTISRWAHRAMLTSPRLQLEGPVEDLSFCADTAESYQWTTDLGVASPMGIKTHRTVAREAVGVVGAITPWNFPIRSTWPRSGPPWPRATPSSSSRRPTPPWCAPRSASHRRAHRHPAGRRQHRHLQRPRRRRAAVERPTGRHGVVHWVDHDRPRRDGRRLGDRSRRSSSSSAASRRSSSSTTPISRAPARCRRSPRRCTPGRAARSPPGWWCRAPATTRPSRPPRRPWARSSRATRRTRHRMWSGDLGRQRDRCRATSTPLRRGRQVRLRRRTSPAGTRVSSSSPR